MSRDVFNATLDLVRYYVRQGTQTVLSLTGIGESLLHPDFLEYVALARQTIGPHRQLTITTNGILLTEEVCIALKPFHPYVFVSLHRPEKAGLAVEFAKKHGILAGINNSFATSAFDWGGTQKNWFVSAPKIKCEYLLAGWAVVLVDGRLTTCCMDPDGRGVFGTVHDNPETLNFGPHSLCDTCHMVVP